MMANSSPTLEVNVDDDGEYTIKVATLFRTSVLKFKLGEEYEEDMPGGILKVRRLKIGSTLTI